MNTLKYLVLILTIFLVSSAFLISNEMNPIQPSMTFDFSDLDRKQIETRFSNDLEKLNRKVIRLNNHQDSESVFSYREVNRARLGTLTLYLKTAEDNLKALQDSNSLSWKSKLFTLRESYEIAKKTVENEVFRQRYIELVNSKIYKLNSKIHKLDRRINKTDGVIKKNSIVAQADLTSLLEEIEAAFKDYRSSNSEVLTEQTKKIAQSFQIIEQKFGVL